MSFKTGVRAAYLLKRDFNTGVFCEFYGIFMNSFLQNTSIKYQPAD